MCKDNDSEVFVWIARAKGLIFLVTDDVSDIDKYYETIRVPTNIPENAFREITFTVGRMLYSNFNDLRERVERDLLSNAEAILGSKKFRNFTVIEGGKK